MLPRLETDIIIIDQLLIRFEPTAVPKEVARIAPMWFSEARLAKAFPRVSVTPALSRPFTSRARLKIKRRIDHDIPEFTFFMVRQRKAKPPMRRNTAPPYAGQVSGRP